MVINHMEPDHGASIEEILLRYPEVRVICTAKAADFMKQFGFAPENVETVKEGDVKSFGKHQITFVMAPMVHWPEVMVTFETTEGIRSPQMRSAPLARWTASFRRRSGF